MVNNVQKRSKQAKNGKKWSKTVLKKWSKKFKSFFFNA